MSKKSYFKQFSLTLLHSLVLLDPQIGPYQVLPLQVSVEMEAMAMKEYSAFTKFPVLVKPCLQIV